jgi:hypothetical protein
VEYVMHTVHIYNTFTWYHICVHQYINFYYTMILFKQFYYIMILFKQFLRDRGPQLSDTLLYNCMYIWTQVTLGDDRKGAIVVVIAW